MTKHLALLTTSLLSFFVTFAQPVIQSFTPEVGAINSTVLITGTGFSTVAANNTVYFGAVKAAVTSSTATTITATVPAGATYQPITVTVNNLTGASAQPFVVTSGGSSGFGLAFNGTSFVPRQDITTGQYPHGVAVADFNLDGKPDVLVSKGSSATVSVLTNTSSGSTVSFAGSELTVSGSDHEIPATGDLDGDGKLDVVVPDSRTATLALLRNTTTGSAIAFVQPFSIQVGSTPYSVAIGDLDGDGKPEVVTSNTGFGAVSVYRNNSTPGNFSFSAPVDFGTNLGPYSIALADLDADGKAEIVLTSQFSNPSHLSVLKNNSTVGNISFQAPVLLANVLGPYTVAVGDLNGDDKPDLVAASAYNNSIVVKQNTSTPGVLSFSGAQNFMTGTFPEGVTITDLDGDTKPDVVVTNQQANTVSVLKNNSSSSGTISFATHVDYAVGSTPDFVSCADLDGDGRSEIITANASSDYISVLKNIIGANVAPVISSFTPGTGVNGTSVTITGTNFAGATAVKFGGVNATSFSVTGSTSITAIVGPGASGDVSVTTAMGTAVRPGFVFNGPVINSFTPAIGLTGTTVYLFGENFTGATSVKFGGVDAASFVVSSATSIAAVLGAGATGDISVTTPNGTATRSGFSFTNSLPVITGFTQLNPQLNSPVTITGTGFGTTVSDNTVFFGAAKGTMISASPTKLEVYPPAGATYAPITVTSNRFTAYSSMPFSNRFTTTNPQISTASFVTAGSYTTGDAPWAAYIKDLNDDGKPEVITINNNNISILKNVSSNGNVSFENKIDWPVERGSGSIAMDDLNGDGKPDLAVVNFNTGQQSRLSVFQNTSTGGNLSFATRSDFTTGMGSIDVAIADMNGDGKPDVIVSNSGSGMFSIFQNTTVGNTITFAAKQDFINTMSPDFLAVADFDKDGRPDIVTANVSNGRIFVSRNVSTGGTLALTNLPQIIVGSSASKISTGDLDQDGKLDLIINTGNQFTFLQNTSAPNNISFANAQNFSSQFKSASVGDLNGDGKPDLCVGQYSSGKISIYENATTAPGNISLAASVDFTTGIWDTGTGIGDLDGDGKPEIVVVNSLNNTATILRNNIDNPVITQFTPTSAHKGDVVTITGPDLSGVSGVNFGGVPASSFTKVSATRIDAVVAGGASGNVVVTTPGGAGSLSGFKFIPDVAADGAATICNGYAVLVRSNAVAGNQWYKNGTLIAGATGTSYQATTTGTYTVTATGSGVTTSSPNGVNVNVIMPPAPPVITLNGSTLTSSVATGNQWYFNGALMVNTTGQTIQPTQNGIYTVRATANGCASDFSSPYNYTVTATVDLGNGHTIKVWPNPVHSTLNLQWDLANLQAVSVEITDMYGAPVLFKQNISSGGTINTAALPNGTYFVKLYGTGRKPVGTVKMLKVN